MNESEWSKPENWPERRRVPGFPKRVYLPCFFVAIAVFAFFFLGDRYDSYPCYVAGFILMLGEILIWYRIIGRFRCPECGERLRQPKKPWPERRLRFRCLKCNIIWDTGIEESDSGG
jgi:hypothetical protein